MGYLARLALIIGAAVLFAGCGGSASSPIGAPGAIRQSRLENRSTRQHMFSPSGAPQQTAHTPEFKLAGSLLYVTNADPIYDLVTIYDPKSNNPTPIAVITKGLVTPNGDCIDSVGTLYVADQDGWVAKYAPGRTNPLKLIHKGLLTPVDCTIDGKGNLWVADVSIPGVVEYLRGSGAPHKIIKNGLTYPNSVVFDHLGSMYVGNLEPYGTSNIQVYSPGINSPSRTITDGVTWPVLTAVDAKGTLYVTNDGPPCNVEEYRSGDSHPYQTITDEMNGPTAVTFGKNGRLYEVNEGTQGCTGPWPAILEFRPGSLTPSKHMITSDLHNPLGVAYYPPHLP